MVNNVKKSTNILKKISQRFMKSLKPCHLNCYLRDRVAFGLRLLQIRNSCAMRDYADHRYATDQSMRYKTHYAITLYKNKND